MPRHKRAIAALDSLFGKTSAGADEAHGGTAKSPNNRRELGAGSKWCDVLAKSYYSERKCKSDFLDNFLKQTLTSSQGSAAKAASITRSKIENKVVTLQNQTRPKRKRRRKLEALSEAHKSFPFEEYKLSNKALKKQGLDLKHPNESLQLSVDACIEMHRMWHDYALGVLERHRDVNMSRLLADLQLVGARVTVDRCSGDPLLIGTTGTVVHQTRNTISLYNAEVQRLFSCIPKKDIGLVAQLAGMTVHWNGQKLIEHW